LASRLELHTDTNRLKQVLINLLSNAIKYTCRGYVMLRAEVKMKVHASPKICISVEDTGVGLSEA
jgi:two-component system sensor histidine kinase BarA